MKNSHQRSINKTFLYSIIVLFLTTACLMFGSSTNPENDSPARLPSDIPSPSEGPETQTDPNLPATTLFETDYIVFRLEDPNNPGGSTIQFAKPDNPTDITTWGNDQNGPFTTDADWSYDGQEIVYWHQGELFLSDRLGLNHFQITKESNSMLMVCQNNIRISPNGERIAYNLAGVATGSCGETLVMINTDGTNRQIIAETASPDGISWSPDGRKLAFAVNVHENSRLYIFDVESGASSQLTPKVLGQFDSTPVWSPDGSTIAFFRNVPPATNGLYLINTDGTNERKITDSAGTALSWSPDGANLAFIENFILFVINADTSSLIQISRQNESASEYAWSPSGEYIALTLFEIISSTPHERSIDYDLYKITINGLAYQAVSNDPQYDEVLIGWLP